MSFDFGRVIKRTFEPLKNNPLTFFGLALVLVALPAAVLGYLQQQAALDMLRGMETVDPDDPMAIFQMLGGTVFWGLVTMGVALITGALLQGSLVHAAVADYRGQKASIGDCLATGLKHLFPLIVLSIVIGIGVFFGLILLIVPGIFLAIKWIVAIPAEVTESTGIGGALGRSWALTKNHWWLIFGLAVIYAIAAYAVQLVLAIPMGTFGAMNGDDPFATMEAAMSPIALVLGALIATVQSAILASGVAAIYYELREAQDGIGAADVAEVFT